MERSPNERREPTEHIFYDGACGLCHGAVSFVARRDPEGMTFRFAPLGGETFLSLVDEATRARLPDSMLVSPGDGRLLMRSTAVVYILRRLGGLWHLPAALLWLVPRPVRNWGYDVVAALRSRWFQAPDTTCPVLPPRLRARFDP